MTTMWLASAAVLAMMMTPGERVGAQDSGIAIGSAAPGAAVETLDGKPADLSQYVGKQPVLFQFWATWCPNCKALEPRIEAAMKKYGDKMKFVAVAVSVNQSVERVKAYKEKHGMSQDILADVKSNFTGDRKCIAVFGEPIDLAPLRGMSNRLASHKRIADRLLERIYSLGEEERAIRGRLGLAIGAT